MNLYNDLHTLTKRNYFERMKPEKIQCIEIAKKYEKDYWDGDRKYGYGGYKYIPGRWTNFAKKLIDIYDLKAGSKVLDIGCGKGYLIYELKKIMPELIVSGCDISKYAVKNSKEEISKFLHIHDAKNNLNYDDNEFDLVISLGVFHNLFIDELENAIKEMNRVGRNKYLLVESYRNTLELVNLQCWGLTAVSLFSNKEWKWLYTKFGYDGDYEFYHFE